MAPEQSPQNNIYLGLRFENHKLQLSDYDQRTADLRDFLSDVFAIDEQNFIILENQLGTQTAANKCIQAFKKFNSFKKISVYLELIDAQHPNPTDAEVEMYFSDIDKKKEEDQILAYRLMVGEVLDEFVAQGYKITPMLEVSASLKTKYPVPPDEQMKTPQFQLKLLGRPLQVMKESIAFSVGYYADRNKLVAGQVTGIEKDLRKQRAHGRVAVVLGDLHSGLIEVVPPRMLEACIASAQSNPFTTGEGKLIYYGMSGLPILDEDLERQMGLGEAAVC